MQVNEDKPGAILRSAPGELNQRYIGLFVFGLLNFYNNLAF
jgi:hypothetical protein